jgi:hypothetical protein
VVHERELDDEPLFHDKVAITRVPIERVVDGPVLVVRGKWHDDFPSWKKYWSLRSVDAREDPYPRSVSNTPATASRCGEKCVLSVPNATTKEKSHGKNNVGYMTRSRERVVQT